MSAMPDPHRLTRLLQDVHLGDTAARERLWDAVYLELHQLAQAQMAREAARRTLQPTALVHEAYLRLIEGGDGAFENRRHFFAAAGKAMRRILVDDARRRGRIKRGGDGGGCRPFADAAAGLTDATEGQSGAFASPAGSADGPTEEPLRRRRVPLDDCAAPGEVDPAEVLAVEEVMATLEQEHPDLARVVELRFYSGMSVEQTAETMAIAPRTVEKYWRAARAWLHAALEKD